jgi:hypothetical protein
MFQLGDIGEYLLNSEINESYCLLVPKFALNSQYDLDFILSFEQAQ